LIAKAEPRAILTVITRSVLSTLGPDELDETVQALREKSKTRDPDNPNLWTHQAGNHAVWGILEDRAGPHGEDVFTILFPGDY